MRISRSRVFENSPVSDEIFSYFNRRFGQYLAPIGLSKVLTIHSAGSNHPRLSELHEARSQEFKTKTSENALKFFDEDMYIYISGEKTIHRMVKDYGEDWDKKCVVINDGNLLFSSLSGRTRQRWLSTISVLLSDENADSGDNLQAYRIRGRTSLLINLATPAFSWHKGELVRTTLGNRLFILHAWLNIVENRHCKENYKKTLGLEPKGEKISEHYNRTIRNLGEYKFEIRKLADDYAGLAVRSPAECDNIVTAIVSENARINHRNRLCDDDILVAKMLKTYNADPMVPDQPRVLEFLHQGRTFTDICNLLGRPKSYKTTISYYRKKALESGALDLD